jgi:hypothetical protein
MPHFDLTTLTFVKVPSARPPKTVLASDGRIAGCVSFEDFDEIKAASADRCCTFGCGRNVIRSHGGGGFVDFL